MHDRVVVDAVIIKEVPKFIAGNQIASSLNFHASNLIKNQSDRQGFQISCGRGRGRGRWNRSDRKSSGAQEGS